MPRRRKSEKGPVFSSVFEWNWHVKMSVAVFVLCLTIQVIAADPRTSRKIMLGMLNVVYLSVFPLMMIWFAEFLEDVFGDAVGLPFEAIVRYLGWLCLLLVLFISVSQFW